PVHLGDYPPRLRPGTSPHALRISPRGGHPALRSTTSGGFRSVLAVSSFRLRARLDLSIPSVFSGQRGYEPRFWIWRPSFGRQRDFNPPEQRAAQRTFPHCRRYFHNSGQAPFRSSWLASSFTCGYASTSSFLGQLLAFVLKFGPDSIGLLPDCPE